MRHEAKLTSKGQLTLPARLRKSLSLKPGDKVVFLEDDQGKITLETQAETLADLRGMIKLDKPVSAGDLEELVARSRNARGHSAYEVAVSARKGTPIDRS